MQGSPNDPHAPTQAKNANMRVGCFVAVAVLAGLTVVAGVMGAAYFMLHDDDTKMKALYAEAENAPGVTEARGVGCTDAVAYDMGRFLDMTGQTNATARSLNGKPIVTLLSCSLAPAAQPPSCEAVAKAYFTTAKPAGQVLLTVVRKLATRAECQQVYDANGTFVAAFDGENPALPKRP